VVIRQALPRHLQHKVFVSLHSFGAKECVTPLIDARWAHNAHSTAGWGWSSSVGYRSEHYRGGAGVAGGAGGVGVPVPVGGSRGGAGEYSSGPIIPSGSTSGRGDGGSYSGSAAAESYENVKRTTSSSSCTVGTEKDGYVDGDACVDTLSLSAPCSGVAVADVPVDLSMKIAEINVNDSTSETSLSGIVRSTSGGGANSTKRKSNFCGSSTISMRVSGSLRVMRKPLRSIKSRKLIKHAKHG
jgi:hypothetical protein